MHRFARLWGRDRILIGLLLLIAGSYLIGCDTTSGPSTDPNAELVLLEPTSNETYHVGDSLHVRWKAQGKGVDEITSVTVALSPDSGTTWYNLKNGSIPKEDIAEWGNYGWKIPATLTTKGITFILGGRKALVRVQDYLNSADPNRTAIVPISIQP